jgi:hypothetical protein
LSLSQGGNNAETPQDYSTKQNHGEDDINQLRRRIMSILQIDGGSDDPMDN